jgi:hypothetical protein
MEEWNNNVYIDVKDRASNAVDFGCDAASKSFLSPIICALVAIATVAKMIVPKSMALAIVVTPGPDVSFFGGILTTSFLVAVEVVVYTVSLKLMSVS